MPKIKSAPVKQERGLRLLTQKKRDKIASMGGQSVVTKYGVAHMAKLGRKGGTNKAKNAR